MLDMLLTCCLPRGILDVYEKYASDDAKYAFLYSWLANRLNA